MANMSYCIMENTYEDLKQAVEHLVDKGLEGLSETERKYAAKLFNLCQTFRDVYEIEYEKEEVS